MVERIKRSHYLSRFYLAGFANSSAPDVKLYVCDLEHGKSWPSNPGNSAIEKYFYAVDLPGEDPDAMEKILAMLEGKFSDVLRWVVANKRLPEGDDFDWFLNFVGSMGARTPRMRNAVGRAVEVCSDLKTRALLIGRSDLIVRTIWALRTATPRTPSAGRDGSTVSWDPVRPARRPRSELPTDHKLPGPRTAYQRSARLRSACRKPPHS